MALKIIQDALLNQLKADTTLSTEFGATNIKKGLEANFNLEAAAKGVRVKGLPPVYKEADVAISHLHVTYDFLVVVYFYVPLLTGDVEDITTVEDKNSDYEIMLRKAIIKNYSLGLGDIVTGLRVGRASFEISKLTKGLYFIAFPVTCKAYEAST